MLVRFQTPAHASITMFGEIAKSLLRMMGMSGAVPGAIEAEDVPAALQRLREALTTAQAEPDPQTEEEEKAPRLSLRAYPLVQLLEAAAKKKQYVVWEERSAGSPSPD